MFAYAVFFCRRDFTKMHTMHIDFTVLTFLCQRIVVMQMDFSLFLTLLSSASSCVEILTANITLSKLMLLMANENIHKKFKLTNKYILVLDSVRIELISCIAEQATQPSMWLEAAKWRYNMLSLLFPIDNIQHHFDLHFFHHFDCPFSAVISFYKSNACLRCLACVSIKNKRKTEPNIKSFRNAKQHRMSNNFKYAGQV